MADSLWNLFLPHLNRAKEIQKPLVFGGVLSPISFAAERNGAAETAGPYGVRGRGRRSHRVEEVTRPRKHGSPADDIPFSIVCALAENYLKKTAASAAQKTPQSGHENARSCSAEPVHKVMRRGPRTVCGGRQFIILQAAAGVNAPFLWYSRRHRHLSSFFNMRLFCTKNFYPLKRFMAASAPSSMRHSAASAARSSVARSTLASSP